MAEVRLAIVIFVACAGLGVSVLFYLIRRSNVYAVREGM
jgi:hypothetical protein